MTGRTTIKTHGTREPEKREKPKAKQPTQLDHDLDRDLGDSFPASDPPADDPTRPSQTGRSRTQAF